VLLVASYLFYAADSLQYLALLILITLASYQGGRVLSRNRSRVVLAAYVGATLAPLALFKLGELAGVHLPLLGAGETEIARATAIPIGISFYTLQAVSHVVDIYRRVDQPTSDLETHALYLAFFPQLLAGPIERASRLVPQLRELPTPSPEDLYIGAKTMLWGYFCKLVVADNLGGIVDRVLSSVDRVPAASLPASLYLYSFQLYFDFLGYTMIAIGLGRTFGIALTPNFDRPYLTTSLRDFWRRWHITLSSWLRDYLYRPLGGQRHGYARFVIAISVTFLVSGLWHGAAVNFLIWGGIHAVLFLAADALARIDRSRARTLRSVPGLDPVWTAARVWVCFSAVSFAWLFFRVEDLGQIGDILSRMSVWIEGGAPLRLAPLFYHVDTIVFILLLGFAFVLDSTRLIEKVIASVPTTTPQISRELAVINTIAIAVFLLGDLGSREFIYFRF
jgi:D-alanyl-lipoteichoic acid acyltransferase DltB (MBOAT superfamily)